MSSTCLYPALLVPERIATISRRSASLSERAVDLKVFSLRKSEDSEDSGNSEDSEFDHQSRLARWQAEAAGGLIPLFHKRLQWDGIPVEAAAAMMSDEGMDLPKKRPRWLTFLERLPPYDAEERCNDFVDAALERNQAPFAVACRPFLINALLFLDPQSLTYLPESVVVGLTQNLLEEISKIAAPVLFPLFRAYLKAREALPDATRQENYHHFTTEFKQGCAWADPLVEFAGLAKLLAVICVGWATDLSRFSQHLAKDHNQIGHYFFPEDSLPTLASVGSGISDRHEGAGTVKLLTFSNGKKLVYKRRSFALEADFQQLLKTLDDAGLENVPPSLLVLPCDGYGWVEHAETVALADHAALKTWFEKAGGLLCLMYLLSGNDGHMENVIATVNGPVLIDLETLLQPGSPPSEAPNRNLGTFSIAAQRVQDSVRQTGLLPLWQRGRQGVLYDIGGLTAAGGYESPASRMRWENVGTDGINPAWHRGIASGLKNLPTLAGVRHSAEDHLPALGSGFAQMWRFLAAHPDLIHSTLQRWTEAPLRVLLRPTTHYAALLDRSLSVDLLKCGVDRSLGFEALRRPFIQNHEKCPPLWPAVKQEIQALENGDIPLFFLKAGGRDLLDSNSQCLVTEYLKWTPLETATAKLRRMDEAGLQLQLEMIGAAFIRPNRYLPPETDVLGSTAGDADPRQLLQTVPLISDQGLIKTAAIIGNQIINAAICGRDGFVTWMTPSFLHPDQKEQRGGSYYLYDGASGIALFLAALAKVTGSVAARETALAAMEPVRAILDSPNATAMISREGIGGYSGLGSLIYSLTLMARLMDAPPLMERARRISALIHPARIAQDHSYDILTGSAGTILALLALYRACGDPDVLEKARACGNHLLTHAVKVGDDAVAWYTWPDRLLLAGYSHGAAGGAVALLALYQATGEEAYAHTARAALRYERSLFDAGAGNWPILLQGGGFRFASTWCHGAPGILLSRAAFLGQFGEAEDALLREEMSVAQKTTVAAGLSKIDHLCCGTMGRVAILEATASVMPSEQNLELAKLGATLTIRRAQERKAFSLQTDPLQNSVFQPSFFRGTSGIGYTFLRLARPDLVPSLFRWDI